MEKRRGARGLDEVNRFPQRQLLECEVNSVVARNLRHCSTYACSSRSDHLAILSFNSKGPT
jgi:hypothetical protein